MNKIPKLSFRSSPDEFEMFYKIKNDERVNQIIKFHRKKRKPHELHISLDGAVGSLPHTKKYQVNIMDTLHTNSMDSRNRGSNKIFTPTDIIETEERSLNEDGSSIGFSAAQKHSPSKLMANSRENMLELPKSQFDTRDS